MTERAESVMAAHPPSPVGRGGSIPASALFFQTGFDKDAFALVVQYHYSHRIPANVQLACTVHLDGGLFGGCGECVGGCVFSIPPTRWSEDVIELSRLIRRPGTDYPLSRFVAWSLREAAKIFDLVVSFADTTHDHNGTIYQATNFRYGGYRPPRMDGVYYGGDFIPGRSANAIWNTQSPRKLAERGIIVEPHYDCGKHIYWFPFGKFGEAKARRLGLKNEPYPRRIGDNHAQDQ